MNIISVVIFYLFALFVFLYTTAFVIIALADIFILITYFTIITNMDMSLLF